MQTMPHGTLPLLYTFHFYLFSLISVVSALLFVTRKSPVAAALWLVNTMFCLAALYVMLDAQFIGAIQVLVYAGAIMVVFLFVIMLLNLGHGGLGDTRGVGWKLAAGAIAPIAAPLFHEYLLAFEVTSVLLLAAVVGAVVLGKQRGEENAR